MAIRAGVTVVPGTDGAVTETQQAIDFVDEFGLPVIIKASMGGGGKGMRVVRRREDLVPFFESASSEAKASFGDGSCFIERYVEDPRHIEVQIIGDGKGNVVHLWERDCSAAASPKGTFRPDENISYDPALLSKLLAGANPARNRFTEKVAACFALPCTTSLQVIEIAPAWNLPPETRCALHSDAVRADSVCQI